MCSAIEIATDRVRTGELVGRYVPTIVNGNSPRPVRLTVNSSPIFRSSDLAFLSDTIIDDVVRSAYEPLFRSRSNTSPDVGRIDERDLRDLAVDLRRLRHRSRQRQPLRAAC